MKDNLDSFLKSMLEMAVKEKEEELKKNYQNVDSDMQSRLSEIVLGVTASKETFLEFRTESRVKVTKEWITRIVKECRKAGILGEEKI